MDVVRMIESSKTEADKPLAPVVIADCGELAKGQDDGVRVDPEDPFAFSPEDNKSGHHDMLVRV